MPARFAAAAAALLLALAACGCSGNAQSPSTTTSSAGSSSSAALAFSPVFHDAVFSEGAAETDGTNYIDLSHIQDGYLAAASTGTERLKLQVSVGEQSYNYDLPNNGEPIVVPLNMGNGTYVARVMQNTTGNRYIELFSAQAEVELADELAPFLRPNVYCNYSQDSDCVRLAGELCSGAATESEAFDAIYDYIAQNIGYDREKATALEDGTGYVPDPDETLASQSGICFDYASLTAAMLRSQGIPTKILTGYVSPDNVYHAWDMIYIDGTWASLHISAQEGQWARADMTFAANGASEQIGDASAYADRYTY